MCSWLTIENTLAYYEICPFAVNYESVMSFSTGPSTQRMMVRSSYEVGKKFVRSS
jgi:hypothetical protein